MIYPLWISFMLAIIMSSTLSALQPSMLQVRLDVINYYNNQHQVQLSASEHHGVRSINACSNMRLLFIQHEQEAQSPASC